MGPGLLENPAEMLDHVNNPNDRCKLQTLFRSRFKMYGLFHRIPDHFKGTSTAVFSSLMHTKELTHTES